MKEIPGPVIVKFMEKNLDIMKPPYSEHILSVILALCYIEVPLSIVPGYESQGLK